MPLPVNTTHTAYHSVVNYYPHHIPIHTHTHCLSHMAPNLEMCVPNNEGSQILQNVGNYLLSDKAPHPQRPVLVYSMAVNTHTHLKNLTVN